MDSYGFIWWLLFILWSLVVSHTVAFPCFFFFSGPGGGSAPGHEQRMSTFCRVASFPHLGWRAIFIHGNDRFSVLKSDFEVYKHHMTCVFLFVKSHFPQNLTSRFGRKAWKIWPFSIFQKLCPSPSSRSRYCCCWLRWTCPEMFWWDQSEDQSCDVWDTFASRLTDWFLYQKFHTIRPELVYIIL